jgi:TetR/AcrR family transcriptional regulator, cholesterol catabolism regulator
LPAAAGAEPARQGGLESPTVSGEEGNDVTGGDPGGDPHDDPRFHRLLRITRAMAADGYDAVSMRAIAKEARVSLATIYRFVTSKDQLIAEAHAEGMRHFRAEFARRPPRHTSAERRVRAVLRSIAEPLERDEVRTRTLMQALYSGDPGAASSRLSTTESFRSTIDAAIGGEVVGDRQAVIETLGLVLHGVIFSWLNGTYDAAAARRALDSAVRVTLGATR